MEYWIPYSTNLADTIASHALLLDRLGLKEEISLVLEDSIATFQTNRGLEGLYNSNEPQKESLMSVRKTCCWPLSDGYMELARALRSCASEVMRDDFKKNRTRLREVRKLRGH